MPENEKGLTRRTLVKGAAWSVPVIALASAAPAYAASVPVIGPFDESSAQITSTSTNMSGFYVPCTDDTNMSDWMGDTFTATITITYVGSNGDFSFETVTNLSAWTVDSVTPTQITLSATTVANGCGQGAFQFPAIALTYNSAGTDPGPNSIVVDGSAVNESGTFSVGPLIDMTPCSPTFGQTPVGPRDIPSPCNP